MQIGDIIKYKGKELEGFMIIKCDLCEIEFKKGDTVFEEVKTIYQGNDETYPVEVLHRWCFDCQTEMDKRIGEKK